MHSQQYWKRKGYWTAAKAALFFFFFLATENQVIKLCNTLNQQDSKGSKVSQINIEHEIQSSQYLLFCPNRYETQFPLLL